MKKLILLCIVAGTLCAGPQKLTCNERIKHGPRGLYKGLTAAVYAAAAGYLVWDVVNLLPDLRAVQEHVIKRNARRWPLATNLGAKSLGALALGYLALTNGQESKNSLSIFFTDSENQKSESESEDS